METFKSNPVLIVGAGPTGLVLAAFLKKQNIPFKIIDSKSGPGENSRAMIMHARTLEFYQQIGIADDVVQQGMIVDHGLIRKGDREVGRIDLGNMGKGISPFPFLLCYPQDDHEKFLVDYLQKQNVQIEWDTELVDFSQNQNEILAKLTTNGNSIEQEFAYICGCDGAHSKVREKLDVGFAGGTYEQMFYVADVRLAKEEAQKIVFTLDQDLLIVRLPVRSSGMVRLLGPVPWNLRNEKSPSFEQIQPTLEKLIGAKVQELNWFSTYRVHHRVASHFRVKRAFLAGDAGHIHSPAGGQGMNTGIGDAVNLSWKLAQVIQGRANDQVLETYDSERVEFAQTLVQSTDQLFQLMTSRGPVGEFFRGVVFPKIVPIALKVPFARKFLFKTLSQTGIHYTQSSLSQGHQKLKGGDRLPWLSHGFWSNFDSLDQIDWQLHVVGELDPSLEKFAQKIRLSVIKYGPDLDSSKSGFEGGAAYLVRPDGYIGLIFEQKNLSTLEEYLHKFALKFSLAEHDK